MSANTRHSERTIRHRRRRASPLNSLTFNGGGTARAYGADDTTSDTARLQDYQYTYDAQGRLTHADESVYGSGGALTSAKAWDLAHDGADRLQSYAPTAGSVTGTTWYEYTYDCSDNRGVMAVNGTITQTPTINVLNQIATMNGTTFTYDGNGNLTNDGSKTYTYNAADRLTQVVAGTTTTTLAYDGLGRLLRVSSTAVSAGTPDYYLWCGARICQLRNGTTVGGSIAARETEFDDGAIHAATGNWVFFRDQLGSIRQVRSRTPTQVWVLDYGPYGGVAGTSQVVTTYRFADLFVESCRPRPRIQRHCRE